MLPIATPRLVVRRFTSADLEEFLGYQADPVVRRFLTGEPHTAASAATHLAAQATLDDAQRDAWHGWAIEHRGTGRLIGDIGVWLPAASPTEGDLGFQIAPDAHGQGYAREAALAVVDRLFADWSLTRVTASCSDTNERSARLLLGLGMSEVDAPPGDRSFELLAPR